MGDFRAGYVRVQEWLGVERELRIAPIWAGARDDNDGSRRWEKAWERSGLVQEVYGREIEQRASEGALGEALNSHAEAHHGRSSRPALG